MIESRYKIEYVLPDDESKKTPSFRMFWYFLLIPLVLLAVTAITYDFSYNKMHSDALVLLQKAKVHVFNLGDAKEIKISQTDASILAKKIKEPIIPVKTVEETNTKKPIKQTLVSNKPSANKDKDKAIISELTAKQEMQLKTIKEQISKNTELSANLNRISEQLVLEQVRNEQLNSKLAKQEKDKIELENQLNQALESNKENDVKTTESLIVQEELKPELSINFPEAEAEKAIVITPNEKTVKEEQIQEENQETAIEPMKPEEPKQPAIAEQSETDKIIAAMSSIESDKETTEINTQNNNSTNPINDAVNTSDEVAETQKVANTESTLKEVDQKTVSSEPAKAISTTSTNIVASEKTEEQLQASVDVPSNETDIQTEAKDVDETTKNTNTQATGNNSAVDDIIAAMQTSEATTNSEETLESEENTNSELAQDKTQN